MRELLQPFVGCRLCWRITFAVFALILAVEAAILFPSARRFAADERQRIAGYGVVGVSLYAAFFCTAQSVSASRSR
jgi:threonine/homoserine efflux transporter RhtA